MLRCVCLLLVVDLFIELDVVLVESCFFGSGFFVLGLWFGCELVVDGVVVVDVQCCVVVVVVDGDFECVFVGGVVV